MGLGFVVEPGSNPLNRVFVELLIDVTQDYPTDNPSVVKTITRYRKGDKIALYKERPVQNILPNWNDVRLGRIAPPRSPVYWEKWENGKGAGFGLDYSYVKELYPIKGYSTLSGYINALNLVFNTNKLILLGLFAAIIGVFALIIPRK